MDLEMSPKTKTIGTTRKEKKPNRIRKILSSITVEPLAILCVLPSSLNQVTTWNLYLEKTCRVHLSLNQTTCDALSERRTLGLENEEAQVQKHVASLMAVAMFIQGFFPVCLILFLGSWSDRYSRRKPLILAPILGEIVAAALLFLNALYFEELPVIMVAISGSLPPALMGGSPCLLLGIYNHICSLADDENKTVKIGIYSTIHNMAMISGISSSGIILASFGFVRIYSLSFVMLIVSFIYGFLRIHDTKLDERGIMVRQQEGQYFDIFRIKHIKGTLKLCFMNGKYDKRNKIIIILLLSIIVLGPIQGESAVFYLYTRLKFDWNELNFSIFFLAHSIFDIFGSSLAIIIFAKILKWKDTSISLLALCFGILASLTYALAPNDKIFYSGILLDCFYTVPCIILRSLMAKVVPIDEFGRSNSVFGLSESLLPLLFGTFYSTVYRHTMEIFPGAFYLVTTTMYSIGICLLGYFSTIIVKTPDESMSEENEKLRTPPLEMGEVCSRN